jgi:hypothetical protein
MSTNNSINANAVTPFPLVNGGTSASLTASNGGLLYSTASAMAILAGTATANQIPLSGSSTTPSWSTATYLSTLTANEFIYASSSNTMAQLATANSAMIVTSSTGVPAFSSTMTNGQIIMGSTGATPVANTITAGTNVTVTNGAGTITISAAGAVSWVSAIADTQTMAADTGYLTLNATPANQIVYTLPSAPAAGTLAAIAGFTTGGWQLLPGAGDSIQIGNTTAATSVTSANRYDSIELVYTGSADATWVMLNSVTAGFVIV